jgi:hypothetical protein
MYRTLDTYTIKLSQPIQWDMVEAFNRLLEAQHLLADFRECFDALAEGKFQFTTSCSYKGYKKFFLFFFQTFGPFAAEVSFNEDYPPEGCGYNTTVNFEVDRDGNYVFALLNILSADHSALSTEEYNSRIRDPAPPFEANCRQEGNIFDWNNIAGAKGQQG